MSYQVLARKWRPKSFVTLVGQDPVVRALTNALEKNRLHHAYLFTGTRGVGKTTLARILAKALNCEAGISATPCGVCTACAEIDKGRFVDLIEVDAASNTQVDAMRDLLDNAQYAPTVGRFKIYIIDEVHMLSKNAFNAMLKTLEEPPEHVKFILATTDPQKVPVTVLSRCLQFNLRRMANTSIVEHLQDILKQENVSFEPSALHLIARAAAGSMRDALSLTDQAIAYGGQKVNETEVRAMLGAVDQSYLYQLLTALLANDGPGLMEQAQAMEARSLSFEVALNDFAQLLHQIAVLQTVPGSIAVDAPEREVLSRLAQQIHPETLQLYYQIAVLGRRDIGLAPDEFAGFTMSLLRMLAFTPKEADEIVVKKTAPLKTPVVDKETPPAPQAVVEPPKVAPKSMSAPALFDGNWRGLVDQLKLGLARTLAQNCEMVAYTADSISLRIPESQKHLLLSSYQEKLTVAVIQHFNKKIKLQFSIGSADNTPAQQFAQEKAQAQSGAVTAIENDSFVQALIHDFGAEIVPNSIKPI